MHPIQLHDLDAEANWILKNGAAAADINLPFIGWPEMSALAHARMAAAGANVVLTGQGGDLIVQGTAYGYTDALRRGDLRGLAGLYRHARQRSMSLKSAVGTYVWRPLLREPVRQAVQGLVPGGGAEIEVPDWVVPDFVRRSQVMARAHRNTARDRAVQYSRYSLPLDISVQGMIDSAFYWHDLQAARHGLEVRHPFMDRRLAEFALGVPGPVLCRDGWFKWVLRQALADLLPASILERQDKTGLLRYAEWSLMEKEASQVSQLLSNPISARMGFVDAEALQQRYTDCQAASPPRLESSILSWIQVEIWLRAHSRDVGETKQPSSP